MKAAFRNVWRGRKPVPKPCIDDYRISLSKRLARLGTGIVIGSLCWPVAPAYSLPAKEVEPGFTRDEFSWRGERSGVPLRTNLPAVSAGRSWEYPLFEAWKPDSTGTQAIDPAFEQRFSLFIPGTGTPALIDIDGDGDIDGLSGNTLFENVGTPSSPRFADAKMVDFSFSAYADIDGDGDLDGFNVSGGNVFFSENSGSATNPAFAAPQQDSFGLSELDPVSIVFADLDADGDNDAVYRIRVNFEDEFRMAENTGTANAPAFAPGEKLFGGNDGYDGDPDFADLDGDGDLDAVVGFYYNALDVGPLLFENVGTSVAPEFEQQDDFLPGLTGSFGRAPIFADMDADNDPDAFLSSGGGHLYYENTGSAANPTFEQQVTDPFGVGDVGAFSRPTFVDLDADGDLDLLAESFCVNCYNYLYFFENTGTATAPVFAERVDATKRFGLTPSGGGLSFADFDGDGDLDVVKTWTFGIEFFKNTGTPSAPVFTHGVSYGFDYNPNFVDPTFVDIDDDGDQDLFVSHYYSGKLFYENIGTPQAMEFAEPSLNTFAFSSQTGEIEFTDVDLDGDYDAIVTGSQVLFFENTGTPSAPSFAAAVTDPFGLSTLGSLQRPTFGDLDGDGDPDVIFGDRNGLVYYFENTAEPVLTDTTAPECGLIETEVDPETNKLIAVRTSAMDPESGIALARFSRLRNMEGFLDGEGPFRKGDSMTFDPAVTASIQIRGERIDMNKHGQILVEITNGAGLTSTCDPVVESVAAEMPTTYFLGQNYPNPFNPSTTIRFDLPEAAGVRLALYDVTGRLVRVLVEGSYAAGPYEVTVDAGDLPSGTYLYRIEAGSYVQVRSMVLLR